MSSLDSDIFIFKKMSGRGPFFYNIKIYQKRYLLDIFEFY